MREIDRGKFSSSTNNKCSSAITLRLTALPLVLPLRSIARLQSLARYRIMLIIGGYRQLGRGRDKSMFVLSNVVVGRKPATPATAWGGFSNMRLYATFCLLLEKKTSASVRHTYAMIARRVRCATFLTARGNNYERILDCN